MSVIGVIESLWRYPVKSMRGEELDDVHVSKGGVFGDRLYAIKSAAHPKQFPYLTARELPEMLLYQPHFQEESKLQVELPSGATLKIDDPELLGVLKSALGKDAELSLLHTDYAMGDMSPLSLISIQTAAQIAVESNTPPEKRRYRANVYIDLMSNQSFDEDKLVSKTIQIGDQVIIEITAKDPRCKMITLHPDTGVASPEILKQVSLNHEISAGIYANVLSEGVIKVGDGIVLV